MAAGEIVLFPLPDGALARPHRSRAGGCMVRVQGGRYGMAWDAGALSGLTVHAVEGQCHGACGCRVAAVSEQATFQRVRWREEKRRAFRVGRWLMKGEGSSGVLKFAALDLHYWPPISDLGWRLREACCCSHSRLHSRTALRCSVPGSGSWGLYAHMPKPTREALCVAPPPLRPSRWRADNEAAAATAGQSIARPALADHGVRLGAPDLEACAPSTAWPMAGSASPVAVSCVVNFLPGTPRIAGSVNGR